MQSDQQNKRHGTDHRCLKSAHGSQSLHLLIDPHPFTYQHGDTFQSTGQFPSGLSGGNDRGDNKFKIIILFVFLEKSLAYIITDNSLLVKGFLNIF